MQYVKNILIFLLIINLNLTVFATAQFADRLVYKGDTLLLFANPLEPILERFNLRNSLFGDKSPGLTTACYRGYIAEWSIIDNYLYLTNIYSCNYPTDSLKADIKQFAGEYYKAEGVRAIWFSGNIIIPKGKLLLSVNDAYQSVYEKEIEMSIKFGRIVNSRTYDNSKARQSKYSKNSLLLTDYINSNINWDSLPTLTNKNIRIILKFSANEDGIIDSVDIIRGYEAVFDNEAIRIIKSIPEWDINYRRGHFIRRPWFISVNFSESQKNNKD